MDILERKIISFIRSGFNFQEGNRHGKTKEGIHGKSV